MIFRWFLMKIILGPKSGKSGFFGRFKKKSGSFGRAPKLNLPKIHHFTIPIKNQSCIRKNLNEKK
jgi:hypothetical protein